MPDNALPPTARVRMYDQELGDCFLVSLAKPAGGWFHLLIDCGTLLPESDAVDRMKQVARDVAETTGGRIDVVVATHEHWDHVSGFLQARDVFDDLRIDEVWLPWTEDPDDPAGQRIRRQRRTAVRGLRAAAARLAAAGDECAAPLRQLLARRGPASCAGAQDAIEYLVNHPSAPRVRYQQPGPKPIDLTGVAGGARAYVLGPARDARSSQDDGSSATDERDSDSAAGVSLFAASGGLPATDVGADELNQAFEPRYRIEDGRAAADPFFHKHYFDPRSAWRQIQSDWLGAAAPLALALDNHTNSTSLALAIELGPGGAVLLFPGDAPAKCWPAWQAFRWRPDPPPARAVTTADLLARTVLYKVAHHGSDTAAPDAPILQLMSNPDLVAMLPVSRAAARRLGWAMPFPPVLDRLRQRTRGRILQPDLGMPDRPDSASVADWTHFADRVEVAPNDLYIQYNFFAT